MVLRSKKREVAIQLITMDPQVCGKLLTTHLRGKGVDVEALHSRFPLRRSTDEGSKMGSRGYRRLRWWKQGFVVLLDVFGVRGYIQEEEVGRWSYEGRASLPRGLLVDFLTSTPSPLGHVCSKNNSPEGFILFGFRLIFLFCETLEQEKIAIWTGPWVSRLVPKII